jgi:hypothetical protein
MFSVYPPLDYFRIFLHSDFREADRVDDMLILDSGSPLAEGVARIDPRRDIAVLGNVSGNTRSEKPDLLIRIGCCRRDNCATSQAEGARCFVKRSF